MYIIVVLSFFLCVSLVIEPLISPIANGMGKIAEMHPRPPMHSHFREPMGFKRHSFPIFLSLSLFFALSTSIRLAAEWYKKEKERNLIEAQKVNSELSFLKAQLNPHFLFNTLNSIYSLANKKSESVTEAIVTLSELMRYMIYEANENIVPLKKEIEHIQNYISLQLLRIKDSSGVKVNIHGDLNYKIEPLLLISFIENAFKYGTDFKGKTTIIIKITIQNNELHLYIYNKSSLQDTKKENSGIGLQNIYNRLNLLYPNAHKLDILDGDKSYEVNLRIQLKNNNS
ncbi:sensor histidine kinase [Wenyingzhuangia sp. 2_MG-2023]|uniref:sensor histidine kinase n=1 Tax=Wenyingzhuangia sp. 2_MG-2023 TaxID=3062639 RepID=UPI0026E30391|nr:sensor histidine kinase [Wenyingzhuangia sp. 2_MG-2023]MDO6738149.1 sensor histidine kinase [Wenyingzhuangia sp. 2_MG-2023]MDO6801527.1 sensor histidine kinase [Wenyingzhuangia sp. 1_MG-2023]